MTDEVAALRERVIRNETVLDYMPQHKDLHAIARSADERLETALSKLSKTLEQKIAEARAECRTDDEAAYKLIHNEIHQEVDRVRQEIGLAKQEIKDFIVKTLDEREAAKAGQRVKTWQVGVAVISIAAMLFGVVSSSQGRAINNIAGGAIGAALGR